MDRADVCTHRDECVLWVGTSSSIRRSGDKPPFEAGGRRQLLRDCFRDLVVARGLDRRLLYPETGDCRRELHNN